MLKHIEHLPENTAGRDFVVGDLHGMYDDLERLLKSVKFNHIIDRLFLVGDLADRGHDSESCLHLLAEPWVYSVMGNHDHLLLASVKDIPLKLRGTERDPVGLWMVNGGEWASRCTRGEMQFYAKHIENMPLAIAVGTGKNRFNVIHAEFFGSDRDMDAGDYSEVQIESLLWGRELIKGEQKTPSQEGLSLTFCGHSVVDSVTRIGQQVFIDTGCYKGFDKGGGLSMIEPRTGLVHMTQGARIVVFNSNITVQPEVRQKLFAVA